VAIGGLIFYEFKRIYQEVVVPVEVQATDAVVGSFVSGF
jgi:hypothetical protein